MSAAAPALPTHAVRMPRNLVLPMLVAAATIGAVSCGFVDLAPNRLVSGQPEMLWETARVGFTAALAACGAALLTLALAAPTRARAYVAAAIAGLSLIITLATAGDAATVLATGAPPAARVALGAGFWIVLSCAALALIDALQRAEAGAATQLAAAALVVTGTIALAKAGTFDALSLAREFASRRDVFAAALTRHVVLVAAAVGPAVLIGLPLGLAALRREQLEAPIFSALNLLQTVPSIALFGLLIGPLSALAKAVIALVFYALLPVARNTLAGIGGVSPAAIDAARGMGMTRRQIFWRVEVPLALPVLIAGLRIVAVQAIGLAVVAALIGAGGLGTFVFDGLGQYATDLVLLGALPAILLALATDFLLRLFARVFARRYGP